ncbi:MAG: hypothetical protein RR285_00200 [Acinetobacter sp.]
MCNNCTLVDTYYTVGPFKCKHCDYREFADSTSFEDDWTVHNKNQRALAEAEQLVADLTGEVDKFQKGWFSTWNSYNTEQIDFQLPELIDPFEYFSGEQ